MPQIMAIIYFKGKTELDSKRAAMSKERDLKDRGQLIRGK